MPGLDLLDLAKVQVVNAELEQLTEVRVRRYLVRRLLLVVPVLLGTMLLVFGLVFLLRRGPDRAAGGQQAAVTEHVRGDQVPLPPGSAVPRAVPVLPQRRRPRGLRGDVHGSRRLRHHQGTVPRHSAAGAGGVRGRGGPGHRAGDHRRRQATNVDRHDDPGVHLAPDHGPGAGARIRAASTSSGSSSGGSRSRASRTAGSSYVLAVARRSGMGSAAALGTARALEHLGQHGRGAHPRGQRARIAAAPRRRLRTS